MADLLYTLKRKCGLRRRPEFGLWLWCLSIQCSIYLPGTVAKCQGIDKLSLAVYPEGVIKVLYGNPVELFCVDDKYTADDIDIALGGDYVPSEKVNGTTKRFYKEMHDKGVYSYYCWNRRTKKICPYRVVVDSAPLNVTDFVCISMNLDELNCTWTAPEGFSVTNYSLSFIINGKAVDPCKATKIGKRRYFCSWSTSSRPRYRQLEKQFFFNLKFCNVFGRNEQNFTIDHFSIVKPARVRNLKLIGNGTHNVLLHWKIPNNMIDLLPNGVKHKIEYQIAQMYSSSYFHSVDASSLPRRNMTYRFLLSDLPYAHMPYEVRIYIKPVEATRDEFWSMYSYLLFYTASERPKRPPDTIVGAFDQAPYKTKRRIYVYWKQLEKYEEAGANFTYKVVAQESSQNPKILLADSKKRSFVILDPASLGPINIQIWSLNDNGSSINSSSLSIPPIKDTESMKVPSFTKLAYENGTYKLSWVGLKEVDNYTLFWCQHNETKVCTGRMNFTVLNSKETEHVIDLPKKSRYQFAISANKGAKTSGMIWATCYISKDGISGRSSPTVPLIYSQHLVSQQQYNNNVLTTMAKILPRTMRAVGLYKYLPIADPSSLIDVEVYLPAVLKKDVLVEVKAVAVNPIDAKLRAPKPNVETQPKILGYDGAGVVVDNGQEASIFKPGDEVFFTGDFRRNGSNAQYVALDQVFVAPKPKTLTFEEAAALPLISLTAYETLMDRFLLSEKDKGKTLLIINSAGGVGSIASQLAKHLGLKVIGTASRPETMAFSREHGADIVLNHTQDLIPQLEANCYKSGVDYILVNFDPYPYWDTLMKAIKPQGMIGLIVEGSGKVDLAPLRDKSITLVSETVFTRPKYETEDKFRQHEILREVSKLVDSGVIKFNLTKTFSPFNAANLREAHRLIEGKKIIGKIVLTGF